MKKPEYLFEWISNIPHNRYIDSHSETFYLLRRQAYIEEEKRDPIFSKDFIKPFHNFFQACFNGNIGDNLPLHSLLVTYRTVNRLTINAIRRAKYQKLMHIYLHYLLYEPKGTRLCNVRYSAELRSFETLWDEAWATVKSLYDNITHKLQRIMPFNPQEQLIPTCPILQLVYVHQGEYPDDTSTEVSFM